MTTYYNEIDPFAAAWLRELIKAGHIAPGEVDERSIEDVRPVELLSYTQCHFFAGIGVWSYALRQAGWPDGRQVWTGSCPCQPFSAAGKGAGFADERHLWPAWQWLISQCKPGVIFGEQVAAKSALPWLDLVSSDLEGTGYAVGPIDLCAAGFGAPHIRQRLFFVAESVSVGCRRTEARTTEARSAEGWDKKIQTTDEFRQLQAGLEGPGGECVGSVDNATNTRRPGARQHDGRPPSCPARSEQPDLAGVALGDTKREGLEGHGGHGGHGGQPGRQRTLETGSTASTGTDGRAMDNTVGVGRRAVGNYNAEHVGQQPDAAGPCNGFWSNADWLPCIDGKARPVESGTFPLVTGAPARVGRLRGYGNAINAEVAKAFIEAYLSS